MTFARAARALGSSLPSVAGGADRITYRRGSEASAELLFTRGQSTWQQVSEETGAVTTFTTRDFVVLAESLVLDGEPIEPRAGDQIDLRQGVAISTFEVTSPVAGERPFRYCDSGQVLLRIHTRRVRGEEDE